MWPWRWDHAMSTETMAYWKYWIGMYLWELQCKAELTLDPFNLKSEFTWLELRENGEVFPLVFSESYNVRTWVKCESSRYGHAASRQGSRHRSWSNMDSDCFTGYVFRIQFRQTSESSSQISGLMPDVARRIASISSNALSFANGFISQNLERFPTSYCCEGLTLQDRESCFVDLFINALPPILSLASRNWRRY